MEIGQPPADDRRRGDVTYSGSSLECGRQIRSAWRHLLLAVEDGQFEKTWHYDEQTRRENTMLRLRNPIVDGIRGFGLHPPQEETLPDEQGTVDVSSLRDTLMAPLSGNQTVGQVLLWPSST